VLIGRAEAFRLSMHALIEKGSLAEVPPSQWAPFVVVDEGPADWSSFIGNVGLALRRPSAANQHQVPYGLTTRNHSQPSRHRQRSALAGLTAKETCPLVHHWIVTFPS